jgi:hypothetical protein
MGLAGLDGLFQRLGVHIAVHQHLAAGRIGGHHRQQPVCVEFRRQFVAFLDLLDRLAGGEKARACGCHNRSSFQLRRACGAAALV